METKRAIVRFSSNALIVCLLTLAVFGGFACQPAHSANVQTALAVVFGHEGGLQCEATDPGNWTSGKIGVGRKGCTKYGIATNTYPNLDIRNISLTKAGQLYTRDFWNPLHLSEFEGQAVATELFDTSVNCGVGTGANMFVHLVNIFAPAHYALNGKVNSEQVEWYNKFSRKKINRTTFWKALNVLQGERYLMIMERNPGMLKYGNSWYGRVGIK